MTKRLKFDVEILELNDTGTYEAVAVEKRTNNASEGCFLLRQVHNNSNTYAAAILLRFSLVTSGGSTARQRCAI